MENPEAGYAVLRSEAPVWQEPDSGVWFVSTYEHAEEIMRNHNRFSAKVDRISMRKGGLPKKAMKIREEAWPVALTLSHNDERSHDDYRKLVSSFFLPRRLKIVLPFVEERIETLLKKIDDNQGKCDFVSAFTVPLPVSVIGEYLGMRHLGDDNLKKWSDAFADEIGFLTSDGRAIEIAQLTLDCHREMVQLADERRGTDGDDIITSLANATLPCGRSLDNPEILSILTQLLVAGNETTTSTLNFSLANLAQSPETFDRLKAEPDLIPRYIEEILRVESPIQGQFRKAVGDQMIGGQTIPDGALIHVRFGSVNHDEAVWGDYSTKINLEAKHAKPHMAFGNGIHFCVGAALSRMEMKYAQEAVLARYNRVTLSCSPGELPFNKHFHQRGMTYLPLEFEK